MTEPSLGYREVLYRQYRSSQGQATVPDLKRVLRWGAAYESYLEGWLPPEKKARVADVACGGGYLLFYLAHLGYTNLVGVDISAEQVATAQALKQNVEYEDAIAFLQRNSVSFDLVLALDIIEHLTKHEVMSFFNAAHGALRPAGRLVVQTPNCASPFGVGQRYADFSHEVGFTPNSMAWMLRLHGFEGIESREQGPVLRGFRSLVRWLLWRVIRLGYCLYDRIETGSSQRIYTRVFVTSATKGSPKKSER
jgi:2-polyprenyl-3-methyl-5-hydroxy-6-metoxy-1,4-benzoquinol methylase